jgi:prophage DNA circulation protein
MHGENMSINLPFYQSLLPASWCNIPFGVSSINLLMGRKLAIHDYPYVDGVWVEDLGAKGKTFHIMGFIIEGGGAYGGTGTLKQQIEALEKVAEQWGDGIFCHPTLGTRTKMCLHDFEIEQDTQGRTASIRFTLIENKVKPTLMVLANTQAQTIALSGIAKKATILDTLTMIKGAVRSYRNGILTIVNRFITQVRQVIFTATSLVTMITGLPGEIGRYIGSTIPLVQKSNKTVNQLIGIGSASRVNVLNEIQKLATASEDMNIDNIVNGIADTVTAVFKANPDPLQAMNAMLPLINLQNMPIGTDDAKGFNLLNDLIHRIAVICIVQAASDRHYVSYDDAQITRTLVCEYLDGELKIAGDQGLDDTYNALVNLRTSVSQDLTARGGDLAKIEQIEVAASLPSLVWSQRLYQDSKREAELVKSANPIHPAFMPLKFRALSS